MNFFLHHYLIWDVRLEEPHELAVDDHIRMELALTGLIQQVPTDFFFLHGRRGRGWAANSNCRPLDLATADQI